jgi:hypothetical protein
VNDRVKHLGRAFQKGEVPAVAEDDEARSCRCIDNVFRALERNRNHGIAEA